MSKIRGKYKQYIGKRDVPIPQTTFYRWKKELNTKVSSVSTVSSEDSFNATTNITNITTELRDLQDEVLKEHQKNSEKSICSQTESPETIDNESMNEDEVEDIHNLCLMILPKIKNDQELAVALLTVFYKCSMTQTNLNIILKLVNTISLVKIPTNFNSLQRMIMKPDDVPAYEKVWYCEICCKCNTSLDNRFQRACKKCGGRLSMYYHISIKQQLIRILNKTSLFKQQHISKTDALFDIIDGNIYKSLLNTSDGKWIHSKKAFTFTLNTDGIAVSSKSNLTIWPVYLVINELPIQTRFSIDNVIIAGISIGSSKPTFDVFMKPIIKELIDLEYGIKIANETYKFFVIAGVFDKPARAGILNIVNSTGYNSCLRCLEEGKSLETDRGGNHRVFPHNILNPKGVLRTIELYDAHCTEAELSKASVHGIKGKSCLRFLKYYKPLHSTCIDQQFLDFLITTISWFII